MNQPNKIYLVHQQTDWGDADEDIVLYAVLSEEAAVAAVAEEEKCDRMVKAAFRELYQLYHTCLADVAMSIAPKQIPRAPVGPARGTKKELAEWAVAYRKWKEDISPLVEYNDNVTRMQNAYAIEQCLARAKELDLPPEVVQRLGLAAGEPELPYTLGFPRTFYHSQVEVR